MTFFRGGCSFYIKNKMKYEVFNDKKSLSGVRGGWYPNALYKLGHNFNCDFNLLMSMSSLLISNKKKYDLAIDWLLIIPFDVVRRKNISFRCIIGTKEIFFRQSDTCPFLTKDELVHKIPLKRSVLKSQFQNPRNLDEKDWFFHTIHTKTISNSPQNKK